MKLIRKIDHLLKNIYYYNNYTEPKVSKWFYRPCLDIPTFHGKAKTLIWTMFFIGCQLRLSSIHQTNICRRMSGSARCCGPPIPDLLGYDRTLWCWMQPLLLGTAIVQRSKV